MSLDIKCSNSDSHERYTQDSFKDGDECYCGDCYKKLEERIDELEKEKADLEKQNEDLENEISGLNDTIEGMTKEEK